LFYNSFIQLVFVAINEVVCFLHGTFPLCFLRAESVLSLQDADKNELMSCLLMS